MIVKKLDPENPETINYRSIDITPELVAQIRAQALNGNYSLVRQQKHLSKEEQDFLAYGTLQDKSNMTTLEKVNNYFGKDIFIDHIKKDIQDDFSTFQR